jgi:hypothetical protein
MSKLKKQGPIASADDGKKKKKDSYLCTLLRLDGVVNKPFVTHHRSMAATHTPTGGFLDRQKLGLKFLFD